MTREEIIDEIKCLLAELDNGSDAVSYLTHNDTKWLVENIKALEQESILDKITAEINEYGSLWVEYKIEGHSDRDIEKIVKNVLEQAKRQILDVIDKYRQEG